MYKHNKFLHASTYTLLLIAAMFIFQTAGEADQRVDGCQCTDFIYSQRPDIPTLMGHAKDWLYSARVHRIPYDQVPQVGDVAVFLRGAFGFSAVYGHVALVVDVNEALDHFSIVGWNGFKADCKLEIYLDFPVTYNTYFIHHKESVRIQTLSLEEWSAIADEEASSEHKDSDACSLLEIEDILLEPECPSGSNCCQATEPLGEAAQLQRDQKSIITLFTQLNAPLE